MKRYLFLWHRWLGIALCLFMAMWFFSGVVMMYVGYPKLTPREHLAHLPPLALEGCCIDPVSLAADDPDGTLQSVRLTSLRGEPHYVLGYADGGRVVVNARSGERVTSISPAQALQAAQQFAPNTPMQAQGLIDEDAWTHSRGLDAERPLYRVQLQDAEQRLLYISSQTGAVVRDATANERLWNWVGAWIHWLYPLRGNWLQPAWHNTVVYLSAAATVMALLGMLLGVMRWRGKRRYRNGSHSPYSGMGRWHHLVGLGAGALLVTWIFSGLMSMNPWSIFSPGEPLDTRAYAGGVLGPERLAQSPAQSLQRFQASGFDPVELVWRRVAGEMLLVAQDASGATRVSLGGGPVRERLPAALLERAAAAVWPAVEPPMQWLNAYDFYYYPRTEHSMLGHLAKPLPVLRVEYPDGARTWLHIDPYTGEILSQASSGRRTSRVLFALLHSWDWLPLLQNRPLWDVLMLGFSIGGLLISLTGTVMGWRRLRSRAAARRRVRLQSAALRY
ncbi:MAG: PepSY domain-containing protein [Halopseudomonas sp.]|uniref:PepSY domain-containing protein n=1 Tax=Halopseudomonas sp. TaxID=2901191 RepID=UPI0030029EDE